MSRVISTSMPETGNIKIAVLSSAIEDVSHWISLLREDANDVIEMNNSFTAADILARMEEAEPQLVLIDLDFDDGQGIDVCLSLRKVLRFKNMIVVVYSQNSDNYIQIEALNAGADDFLALPINDRLFRSKVKSWLRRFESTSSILPQANSNVGFTLNRESKEVVRTDARVALGSKEFEILSLLVSRPGKVFPRREILSKVWGNDEFVQDRTVDGHIKGLREKLGHHVIKTVIGVGYRFAS